MNEKVGINKISLAVELVPVSLSSAQYKDRMQVVCWKGSRLRRESSAALMTACLCCLTLTPLPGKEEPNQASGSRLTAWVRFAISLSRISKKRDRWENLLGDTTGRVSVRAQMLTDSANGTNAGISHCEQTRKTQSECIEATEQRQGNSFMKQQK